MGYTHYWRMSRDFTDQEWSRIEDYARKIVVAARATGINLANGLGEEGTDPVIDSTNILLNGSMGDGYETFYLTKQRLPFECCKTGRAGYDPVVVTILHAAQTIAPDAIRASSDGDQQDGAGMFHFTDQVPPPTGPG